MLGFWVLVVRSVTTCTVFSCCSWACSAWVLLLVVPEIDSTLIQALKAFKKQSKKPKAHSD